MPVAKPSPLSDASVCGLGLRQPHYASLIELRPPLASVEVHSENFFGDGGPALLTLGKVRELYPVSLHGVGLALGSAAGIDPWHLERLASLVDRVDPVRVSDHASFARAPMPDSPRIVHANDLLPVAFTPASLDIMVRHVSQVQDRLKRTLSVENLSAYLGWADDSLPEPEFFNELVRRSGCRLLVDLNNLVVNAMNASLDPVADACDWVDAVRGADVEEIHLAGFHDLGDIVIDDHGSPVHESVWRVYQHAIKRWGPVATIVEWDTHVPSFDILLGEVSRAEEMVKKNRP